MTKKELCSMIESTNLSAIATKEDLTMLCRDAYNYGFLLVMVNPCNVSFCIEYLKEIDKDNLVKVGTVIDFPLGCGTTETKVQQISEMVEAGVDEIDVVAGVRQIIECDNDSYVQMLKCCRQAARDKVLKVILETCYLTSPQIAKASDLCTLAEVDIIKTSTGFGAGGATSEAVETMFFSTRATAEMNGLHPCEIKASGGVRSYDDVLKLYKAGATRFGTSSAVKILGEFEFREKNA